jgi:conjugative transposon TraN protein
MNLRIILTLSLLIVIGQCLEAQHVSRPLPPVTHIEHYILAIGYDVTTVLIFPTSIKPGDKGKSDREFIVQKQQGVENVLKLKASRKYFTPSNLHVFTSDGRIYAFDISYSASPENTTFDLRKLPLSDRTDSSNENANIILSNTPFDDSQIRAIMADIKTTKAFFSKKTNKYLMKLQLQTIHTRGDFIFFGFVIKNRSDLGYPVDFVRTYITDQQKIKRASNQQTEIIPAFKDTTSMVDGNSTIRYIIGVPRFTLADHKQYRIELFEKDGARNLVLAIKNKQLLRAKPL